MIDPRPASPCSSINRRQRYSFPPLWLVPLLLIGAIIALVLGGMALGLLGVPFVLYGVYRLQRDADRYVRSRQASED
jgi:hypothetical protein